MILYNGFPPSYFIYSFVILSLSLYNKFMDKFVIITAPRETINTIDDSSSSNDSDSELQPPKKVAKMSHYKDNLTYSSMKLIKTRLRSRMGEDTLEHTMRICIEGPDRLTNDMLEEIVDHYKGLKNRRIVL